MKVSWQGWKGGTNHERSLVSVAEMESQGLSKQSRTAGVANLKRAEWVVTEAR
jgi:hypothetical protein